MTEEMLTPDRAACMMDTDLPGIERARRDGHVIGTEDGAAGFLYPDWQFRYDGQPFFDIRNVILAVGGDHGRAYEFMTSTHEELAGQTAWEYLRITRVEDLGDMAHRWQAREKM